jgi:hypothetical protein
MVACTQPALRTPALQLATPPNRSLTTGDHQHRYDWACRTRQVDRGESDLGGEHSQVRALFRPIDLPSWHTEALPVYTVHPRHRTKPELERNITIKLGYANAKIYKADPADDGPGNYRWADGMGDASGVWCCSSAMTEGPALPHDTHRLAPAVALLEPLHPRLGDVMLRLVRRVRACVCAGLRGRLPPTCSRRTAARGG